MGSQHAVIVGASHAAAQLATSLRQGGWDGNISIVGAEAHPAVPSTASLESLFGG